MQIKERDERVAAERARKKEERLEKLRKEGANSGEAKHEEL
jgi:hypothetical protein